VIFITVGLPGRFAEWCAGVLARLAVSLGGSVVVRVWPTVEELLGYRSLGRVLDQIALSLLQDAPAQLVVGARQPDERLCRALAETAAPFILALDDPRLAAADILSQTAVEPAAATRMMANSCPFVMRCTALPGALRLHANDARRDRAGAVATIARHFGLPIDKTRAGRLVRQLAGAGLTPGEAGAFELFAIVGDPERKPTEPIDVSGGARCLVYGPYIHLAPGSWSARVVLGFSSDAIGHVFLVDACCGDRQLAAVNFQPKVAGMHVVQVNFSVADEMGQGVEIRVMVIGDHAQGRVAFGQASLTPLELTDSSTGDAMEVVLGL
jgi:hypothetical protein